MWELSDQINDATQGLEPSTLNARLARSVHLFCLGARRCLVKIIVLIFQAKGPPILSFQSILKDCSVRHRGGNGNEKETKRIRKGEESGSRVV